MRDSVEIVIVGGGVIGCSIAYHLAKLGKRDVVILEKSGLTHGSTWHAAGLIGQLRGKQNLTRMLQYSVQLFGGLEAETGQATDWRPVGSLRIASSAERWQEIKRTATAARAFGFELHLLTAKEARDLFPLMSTEGVVGAAYIPSDGYIDPSGLTQALAKGARAKGVKIREGATVTDIVVAGRRVSEVITDRGNIRCDVLVNAAGIWARQLAALAGVSVPAAALEHQYMVTEKLDGMPEELPTFRDPDKLFYLKPEVGGIALGGWEPDPPPFGARGIPEGFGRELLAGNLERFEQIILPAAERLPILNDVGIRNLINGPIPVSPDGEPIMGKAPELDNFYVACGFTAGIAASGGAGRMMAEWIVEGAPSMDLWAFDLRRFGPHHLAPSFLHARAVESYGRYYSIHWPQEEPASGRGLRRSPLYDALKARGAVYGSKFGWERPNWFAPAGTEARDHPSFGRANWFDAVAEEHRAVRERVALIDQSSFAKFELRGPGALAALERLAAALVDKPVGSVIYTQLCNPRGGIEADLTVCRLDEEAFYIVTGSGFGVHDRDWIESNLPPEAPRLTEVTSGRAVINLCGPRARAVLEKVAEEDVSNAAFAFATCRHLTIGAAPVLALRIGYVGELGFELHMPSDYAGRVYEMLREAGQEFGIADVGYRAIDSLRMEKGYLYWSADITPDYNPFEAGLGGRVCFTKGDFIGREALLRIRDAGPERKLCVFTLEAPAVLHGGEAILCDGEVLGVTTSANFGHTVGKTIAYGYLPAGAWGRRDFEIEAFGERLPARRHDGPLYDPAMDRLKA